MYTDLKVATRDFVAEIRNLDFDYSDAWSISTITGK